MIKKKGGSPAFVKVKAGQYLLNALFEVGPCFLDAMGGERPLGWSEISPYMQATHAITEPWEARVLRDLSREYLAGKTAGTNMFGIAPVDQVGA